MNASPVRQRAHVPRILAPCARTREEATIVTRFSARLDTDLKVNSKCTKSVILVILNGFDIFIPFWFNMKLASSEDRDRDTVNMNFKDYGC